MTRTAIQAIVNKHFKLFFWAGLVLMAALLFTILQQRAWLNNREAPQNIISLDRVKTDSAVKDIVDSWSTDTTPILTAADFSCNCDSTFYNSRYHGRKGDAKLVLAKQVLMEGTVLIFLYVAFFGIVGIRIADRQGPGKKQWKTIYLTFLLTGAAMDLLGNLTLLSYLWGIHLIPPGINYWVAFGKYAILALFFALLFTLLAVGTALPQRIARYIPKILVAVWRYRLSLLGLIGVTLPVWVLDQGQDLLVNINTTDTSIMLFFLVTTFFAFFNWYVSHPIFYLKDFRFPMFPATLEPVEGLEEGDRSNPKIPRLLGVCSFLLPAFAILHALQVFKINFLGSDLPMLLLLAAMIIGTRYLLTGAWLWQGLAMRPNLTRILILVFGIVVPVADYFLADSTRETPLSLIYLAMDLFSMAFAFLIFTSLRTHFLSKNTIFRKFIGAPIIGGAVALSLFFLLANIFPFWNESWKSLPFITYPLLVSDIVFYMLLYLFLIRFGQWVKFGVATLATAGAIMLVVFTKSDYHHVRMIDNKGNAADGIFADSLDNYVARWLHSRDSEIAACDPAHPFPMFLVNSYGGGIRAAAFTGLSIGRLDDSVQEMALGSHKTPEKDFEHFVFSYSGISGGTIGESILCAYRQSKPGGRRDIENKMDTFYRNDFLTPLLAANLGRDVLGVMAQDLFWKDRAALQEQTWEQKAKQFLGCKYGETFDSYWDTTCEVPLLFSNTFNVDSGQRAVLAPVKLARADFPGTIFIRNYLEHDTTETLALSTGAFLSARFPFISPSGWFGDTTHYLDGGLKDYSGAKTSFCINKVIQRVLRRREFDLQRPRVKIYVLSIHSGTQTRSEPDKTRKNMFEWTATPMGLIMNPDGNTVEDEEVNQATFGIDSCYFKVWVDVDCIQNKPGQRYYSPVLPLGWQISAGSLKRLRRSVDYPYQKTPHPAYDRILSVFRSYYSH